MDQPNGAVKAHTPTFNKTRAILQYLREHPNQEVRNAEIVAATGITSERVGNLLSRQLKPTAAGGGGGDWRFVSRVGFGRYVYRPGQPRTEEDLIDSIHRISCSRWEPILQNPKTGEWLLRSPDQQLYVAKPAPSIFEEGG